MKQALQQNSSVRIIITGCFIIWPVVRRTQEVLVLNVNELLGRPNCLHISHLYAYIYGHTLSPHKMLHHTRPYCIPWCWNSKFIHHISQNTLQSHQLKYHHKPACLTKGIYLVWHIGECMVSIININDDIKEPTQGYQDCYSHSNIDVQWVCLVRESLYIRVIIWINTIVNRICY